MSRPVYSTRVGRTCPDCGAAVSDCRCREKSRSRAPTGGGKVRVTLEKKGRRGKTMTVVQNLPFSPDELAAAAKQLKSLCGTGGTVKGDTIELQGDRVAQVREWLEERGV